MYAQAGWQGCTCSKKALHSISTCYVRKLNLQLKRHSIQAYCAHPTVEESQFQQ